MGKRILSVLSFILFLANLCLAQQDHFYGLGKLSSNLISKITQDSSGFIWIATENGLNKFDGWKFTHYFRNDADSTALAENLVEAFLNDKDGRLWVGSGKGLQYYCPYTDAFRGIDFPGNTSPSIKEIVQLHTGEIWVVTAGYGVFSIDVETRKAISLSRVNQLLGIPYAKCIFEDRAHQIWIALSNNDMACIAPDRESVEIYKLPIDSKHKIYGMVEDAMGRMFVGSSIHVLLWDNIRQEFMSIENKTNASSIRGITLLKDGNVYVNTGHGLHGIDMRTMSLFFPSKLPGGFNNPVREKISAFFEDRNGNFWLGCYKKGLLMALNEPVQFDFWDFSKIRGEGTLISIYRDKDENLWVGTGGWELLRVNEQGELLSSFRLPKEATCMYEDSNGTFWIGSYSGGLVTLDKKTGQCTTIPRLDGKSVTAIGEDKQGGLYFSLFGEGLVRFNRVTGEWVHISDTTKFESSKGLRNNWIGKIMCDSDGLMWFAHSMGVDCYDPAKNFFLENDGREALLTHNTISILEDHRKNIWIGTHNGLFCYNKKEKVLKHYGMDDGLPNNIICGLGIDSEGNIWCSTLNGLFRLNCEDGRVASYYSGNGLVDREYSKNVYYQGQDGALYVGGLYGITRFMPDSVKTHNLNSSPILTHLYLDNTSASSNTSVGGKPIANTRLIDASALNLSYREKTFSLEFSTMNFHNPENVIFEYRLLGMNKGWSSTFPGENRITYNLLAPGDYTLEVRAFENNTYSPVKSLAIHIAPPWYNTTWAKLLYILLVAGLLSYIGYTWNRHQRVRQDERNNEEKLRFFINIAHELRSPITLIISPLAELLKQSHDDHTNKLLMTMQRNANRIMNLINQLLDLRKIDKGQMKIVCEETNLVDFISELFQVFDYQATKRNIFFSFESDVENLPVWIDRNNFDKILMNLLVNAFKYTPDSGEIMVFLTLPEAGTSASSYAEIRIIDSGSGLDEKEMERIFERFYQGTGHGPLGFGIGLNLTRMLVEMHHGTIHAANRTDTQGSCFTVRIPLGKDHLAEEEILSHTQTKRVVLETPYLWEEAGNKVAVKNKSKERILVVDDEVEIREYLQRELNQFYKVVTASNGADALQLLLQQRFDLVISDVMMPEMDGFALLKSIKGNNNISHIPVVLLTSQVEFHNRMKGWDVGADGFMDKPFQVEELLLLCNNLIANRSRLKGKFVGIKELEDKVSTVEVKSNDEQLIERLMNLINKNLDNPKFSVETLAKDVGISRTQLHRKLKEITGITTSDFIRNVRLKQAARLLLEKKVNVSQIAYATGFSNPTVFAVAFKKFYGCTPTEYAEKGGEFSETETVELQE